MSLFNFTIDNRSRVKPKHQAEVMRQMDSGTFSAIPRKGNAITRFFGGGRSVENANNMLLNLKNADRTFRQKEVARSLAAEGIPSTGDTKSGVGLLSGLIPIAQSAATLRRLGDETAAKTRSNILNTLDTDAPKLAELGQREQLVRTLNSLRSGKGRLPFAQQLGATEANATIAGNRATEGTAINQQMTNEINRQINTTTQDTQFDTGVARANQALALANKAITDPVTASQVTERQSRTIQAIQSVLTPMIAQIEKLKTDMFLTESVEDRAVLMKQIQAIETQASLYTQALNDTVIQMLPDDGQGTPTINR